MWKKTSYTVVQAGFDTGLKLSMWQFFYGGTWSAAEYADYNAFKYIFCANLAAIPTMWTGVPFEMARRAYYADTTWPLEMRRGYTSPFNALLRIPFEEGPAYLFKGGSPIMFRDFMFFSYFFATFAWLKNKLFFFWVYQDFSYEYIKFLMMTFSWYTASLVSYPAYFAREMVDLWPKERGGACTFQNSYKRAFMWWLEGNHFTNMFAGHTQFLISRGIPLWITMWLADNLGMFSNISDNTLGIDNVFPMFLESA